MDKTFNIRQAKIDDLDSIVSFTHAIHLQEDDQSIPTHTNFLSNLTTWLTAELNNPLSLFLIVEKDKQPVGFIGATTVINDNGFLENPTKGVINLLWVEESFRRNQLAKKLVTTIENCFLDNSVSVVECSFTKHNQLANDFWCNAGYTIHSLSARKFIS